MSRRKYTNLMIVTSIKQLISSRVSRPAPELVAETEQFLKLERNVEAAFNVKRGKKGLPAWVLGAA